MEYRYDMGQGLRKGINVLGFGVGHGPGFRVGHVLVFEVSLEFGVGYNSKTFS